MHEHTNIADGKDSARDLLSGWISRSDLAQESDHMLRIACRLLVQHGETPEEREDARILLVVLEAKTPGRAERHRTEPEGRS